MKALLNEVKTDLEAALDKKDVRYYSIGIPFRFDSKQVLSGGAIFLVPLTTNIESVTTGLNDQETHSFQIILAKSYQDTMYKNAQEELGIPYLLKVVDDRNADRSLKTNSIRYVVRKNMRKWGIKQNELDIEYDTQALGDNIADGYISATITVNQLDINNQPLT